MKDVNTYIMRDTKIFVSFFLYIKIPIKFYIFSDINIPLKLYTFSCINISVKL